MFWGLIMEPNKRYTQTVEKSFHISMASLDPSTNQSNKVTQVMICYDNHNYLLCTLVKDSIYQVPLDLNFAEGTKIAFTCNGGGHVHLTGYLVPEEEDMDFGSLGDEEEEEEDNDEEVPQLVPAGNQKKRKASPEQANKQGKKKSKLQQQQEEDDDDDDEDDEDELANGTMEIDSDDDDDDDDEEEEDDDEDDEDDSDSEVTRVELKPGLLAKQEKKRLMEEKQALQQLKQKASPNQQQQQKQKQKEGQNQQQQQQQQKKKDKKEKNKLANGKADGKPEQQQQQQQKKGKEEVAAAAAGGEKPEQKKRTIEGGIQLEEVKVGEGAVAKAGKFVTVYYTGRLKNGKKFDSTTQGAGFKFRLGKGEVIKGWDLGVAGMKVGGKRKLLIPPALAYGARGSPPVIPPNSVLNFEVELRAVH